MSIYDVKLNLPEKLRKEAESAGLLNPTSIERLLREEIRRRRVDKLFAAADRLAGLDLLPMTDEEVEAEIRSARRPTAA